MTIEFTVPNLRIESANRTRDRHWAVRKKATDAQRQAVYWAYREAVGPSGSLFTRRPVGKRPFAVTLTRIAPRPITDEHDNLRSGFKAVVDMIAELLGCDDGDAKRVSWAYAQQKGAPKTYGITVRIEAAS